MYYINYCSVNTQFNDYGILNSKIYETKDEALKEIKNLKKQGYRDFTLIELNKEKYSKFIGCYFTNTYSEYKTEDVISSTEIK